jgi:putative NIF3 family GTP cyclohydrolase 1 type 2
MQAQDFLEHCRQAASWVNWEKTVDTFMAGPADAEVRGIAVTWLATNAVLRDAAERGLNFVIAHEGAFYPTYAASEPGKRHHEEKRRLIADLGLTLMRCHDTWDRMPDVGIVDSWAAWLGFETEPRPTESYYRICLVEGRTVEQVARHVLEKVRPLGQGGIEMMGNPEKKVHRMAVGTGAITRLDDMAALDCDIILATDDGIHTTNGGLWSLDLDIPVLVVSHATAELPGTQAMVGYLEDHFPGVPVEYLPGEFPRPLLT